MGMHDLELGILINVLGEEKVASLMRTIDNVNTAANRASSIASRAAGQAQAQERVRQAQAYTIRQRYLDGLQRQNEDHFRKVAQDRAKAFSDEQKAYYKRMTTLRKITSAPMQTSESVGIGARLQQGINNFLGRTDGAKSDLRMSQQLAAGVTAWNNRNIGASSPLPWTDSVSRQIQKGAAGLREMAAAADKAKVGMSSLVPGTDAVSRQMQRGVENFRKWRESVAAANAQTIKFESTTDRLARVERQFDPIFRAALHMQVIGYQLVFLAKSIAGAFTNLLKDWGDFEFMVNRAAGALGILNDKSNNASNIYKGLITTIQQTSKELRLFPAEEVAKAVYFWGSTTGQTVKSLDDMKNSVQAIVPIMKLAAMTQTDYETAIKGVYSIIVQYNKSIFDTEDISNKLFMSTQKTALEFQDLIQSFKMVGPVAQAMGVSFEDMTQLLGMLGDAGIRGTMAGRAFRQMFIQLARPTAKASAILEKLFRHTDGLEKGFNAMVFPEGKFVGVSRLVTMLAKSLQNATDQQIAFTLASVTTANELPVMIALVTNEIKKLKGVGSAFEDLDKYTTKSAESAEYFNNNWSNLANSWNGLIGSVTRGVEVIRLQIGGALAAALTPAVDKFNRFVSSIETWVNKNPDMVKSIMTVIGVTAAIIGLSGAALTAAGGLASLWGAMFVLVKGLGIVLPRISILMGAVALLGKAVIENWTYISRTVGDGVRALSDALGISGSTFDDVKNELFGLRKTIEDVFSRAVRIAADAINLVLKSMAFIANSPLKPFLLQIINLLAAAFAIRTIAKIVGVTTAVAKLASVFSSIAKIRLGGTILGSMSVWTGIAGGAGRAAGKVGLLSSAFGKLKSIGPVGWSLVIAGGIEFVSWLRENNSEVDRFFDNLFRNFDDIKGKIADIRETTGAFLFDKLTVKAQDQRVIDKLKKELLSVQESVKSNGSGIGPLDEFMNNIFKTLGLQTDQGVLDIVNTSEVQRKLLDAQNIYASFSKKLTEDTGRSSSEIATFVDNMMTKLGLSFNEAAGLTQSFFSAFPEGKEISVKALGDFYSALQRISSLIRGGLGIKGSTTFSLDAFIGSVLTPEIINQDKIDKAAQVLVDQYNKSIEKQDFTTAKTILDKLDSKMGDMSTSMRAKIQTLKDSMSSPLKAILDETLNVAEEAAAKILAALLGAFDDANSAFEKLKTVLLGEKDSKTGKRDSKTATHNDSWYVKSAIKTMDSTWIAKALKNTKNTKGYYAAQAALDAQVDEIFKNWTYAIDNKEKLKIGKMLLDQFGPAVEATLKSGANLSPENIGILQQIINWYTKNAPPKPKTDPSFGFGEAANLNLPKRPVTGYKMPEPKPVVHHGITPTGRIGGALDAKQDPAVVAANTAKTLVKDAIDKIKAYLDQNKTNITSAVAAISAGAADWFNAGADIITNLYNGLKTKYQPIVDIMNKLLSYFGIDFRIPSFDGSGTDNGKPGDPTRQSTGSAGGSQTGTGDSTTSAGTASTGIVSAAAAAANRQATISASSNNGTRAIKKSSGGKRTIKVEIEVRSPDGSANNMTLSEIKSALRAGGLISNIERLAVVD